MTVDGAGHVKRKLEEVTEENKDNGEVMSGTKKVRREFKTPTDDCKLVEMSHSNFAPKSKKKMKWAVNMYCDWRVSRLQKVKVPDEIFRGNLDDLYNVGHSDLCYALCCFISEVKKVDKTEYPPNTLKEIIVMIQMFLHEQGVYWKLLDPQCHMFASLHNVVDNLMKERTAQGLGNKISSSIISLAMEGKLFWGGILGEDMPEKLLKTLIYMMGLHLALRRGVKHTHLRRPGFNCQITVNVDDKNRERLVYVEDPLQKTNQGGISTRNSSKTVFVYGSSNVERCPVSLFKKYCRLIPPLKSCKKLYLRSKIKFGPSVWYCDQLLVITR